MPRRITRRSALIGAAAGGAATLLRPLQPAGAVGGAAFDLPVGTLSGQPPPLAARQPFVLVGVEWSAPPRARIELRVQLANGRWGPWVAASDRGHEADGEASATSFGEPIWTGTARLVQLRASSAVHGVRLHFIGDRGRRVARAASGFPLASPVLDTGPGQPPIIARAAWAQGVAPLTRPPGYGTVELAFVHHTENPNGYAARDVPAMLLAIHDFHRYVRGWHDIGYNFIVDAFGRIWEARKGGIDQAVVGAQAGGYNQASTGIAVLGSFMAVVPPPAAIAALEQLLAWKLSLHGVPATGRVTVRVNPSDAFYTPFAPGARVSLPRIAGHRDGDSTDCPGDAFYARLPTIRQRAKTLAHSPALITLNAPTAAATAGVPFSVSGRLRLLSGSPLASSPVEVQELDATITQALTDSDGRWQTALTLSHNARLRALHRPAPAAVSDLVRLDVAPRITVRLDSSAPLRVSGEVFPAKRTVILELHAKGRVVMRQRLTTSNGRFSAALSARPGSYQLIAHTQADASNAAGASPPLAVTS